MNDIIFRPAIVSDISDIEILIENCYRGKESTNGWTSEYALLEDKRLELGEVAREMASPNHKFFVAIKDSKIIGVINVFRDNDWVEFGKYAVNPNFQGQGIGRQLINQVEEFVKNDWNVAKLTLCVISIRKELIEFYKRCGFEFTGEEINFLKAHPSAKPKEGIDNLSLLVMNKTLQD